MSEDIDQKPLTKYEALKLAAQIMPDLDRRYETCAQLFLPKEEFDKVLKENYSVYKDGAQEAYVKMLFDVADTILEVDAEKRPAIKK